MTRLTFALPFLCLLILSNSINCQDYSWVGGSGYWSDSQNWFPSGIPQANDEVFIAKGTVYIDSGVSAEAKSIEIHYSGKLILRDNTSLEVAGNINGPGILNYGAVETLGSIVCNNHMGSTDGIGFWNFGKFYIYPEGSYSSTGCDRFAIYNEQKAICNNRGVIEIIDNGRGIKNNGSFINSNAILIDEVDLFHGISNHNRFENTSKGYIQIQGKNEFGIISSESSTFTQTPEFINSGKINVRESDWWCIIVVDGTFTNLSSGRISLGESTYSGLSIDGTSTFNNQGTIVTQNHGQDGIRGIGNLINSGFINSSNNAEHGLRFFDIWTPEIGSIVNSGEIELHDNGIFDIYLEVELHNTDEGYIYSEEGLEGAEIVNDGIFSTWYDGSHNIVFENNGVVEDVHNSMPNIQNNQIRIRPLNGPLVSGVTLFNALDKASSSNTTIHLGWYDQIANGNAGALYFFWTNSIYPNANGAVAPTLWMDATIQSSGQQKRLRINILNAPLPLTQNEEDIISSESSFNIKPEFNIYPNPVVNSLQINASKWGDKSYVFKMYDVAGREVISKSMSEFENVELPYFMNDGTYFAAILDKGEIVFRKKIVVARGNVSGKRD